MWGDVFYASAAMRGSSSWQQVRLFRRLPWVNDDMEFTRLLLEASCITTMTTRHSFSGDTAGFTIILEQHDCTNDLAAG